MPSERLKKLRDKAKKPVVAAAVTTRAAQPQKARPSRRDIQPFDPEAGVMGNVGTALLNIPRAVAQLPEAVGGLEDLLRQAPPSPSAVLQAPQGPGAVAKSMAGQMGNQAAALAQKAVAAPLRTAAEFAVENPLDVIPGKRLVTVGAMAGFSPRVLKLQKEILSQSKGKLSEGEALEIAVANATSRTSGAVGRGALAPRFVEQTSRPGESILDFGAGRDAAHAADLKNKGFDITAYDFGANIREGLHDRNALARQYDTVYASNVINTQESEKMLASTLDQIRDATAEGGRAVFNFPASPRKGAWPSSKVNQAKKADRLEDVAFLMKKLNERFGKVTRVGGSDDVPVFELKNPLHGVKK